ncbi:alanine:cation symporter family protein [Gleimia sp. 6138-11-ORH1]|uniref:alanine/glycine:cation symporter family protein n=1 Tax=Gleimia sp. 6138-11-ORH1 TaxID=2973937 RepID=UPI002167674B|nr:alanine/glycine:cation symporter family protein [Gleimia sp. 6138-11-ORH1]MCS4484860.1 alanine:cation symporter family protein [Gleimia sp. 6138-11-ORH1]
MAWTKAVENINQILTSARELLSQTVGFFYAWILLFILTGVGIFLTVYLRVPQVAHVKDIFTSLKGSRNAEGGQVSSFQAFAVGVGTRVGIGNIAGVALALAIGGPGAIFWMWVIALIGMATSFTESVLAQVYKVRQADGSYRGGPAEYIERGLGWKKAGIMFAIFAVISNGLAVPMVQVNTISATLFTNHQVPAWGTMLIMLALLAPVIMGGMRSVTRVSEWLAPFMALAYILITVVVIALFPVEAVNSLVLIVQSAFGFGPVAGGVVGGVFTALVTGVRRGLFSNEAGLGTTPHVAGSANVKHPAEQGWVQALGVFIDTIIVCTATAMLILISGVYAPGMTEEQAGSLAANAVTTTLGSWMALPVSIIIFIFGYTSVYGAYSYGQVALDHLTDNRLLSQGFKVVATVVAALGAVLELRVVWAISDLLLGIGAVINLVAIVLLAKHAKAVMEDWGKQKQAGKEPVYNWQV